MSASEPRHGPDAYFRDRLSQGVFEIQRCAGCDRHVFYPRWSCPHCGGTDLAWRVASGGGVVYATTVVHRRSEQGGPYNVALVELDEGPRMTTQVVDTDPSAVRIGLRVRARIDRLDDETVVRFVPDAKEGR